MIKHFILLFVSILSIVLVNTQLSVSFGESDSIFPEWFKNISRLWLEGSVTDVEFLEAVQWLVDNNVIVLKESNPTESNSNNPKTFGDFTNIVCTPGYSFVEMTGKYTNGDIPYSLIFLRMILLDQNGNSISTGSDTISDIDANVSRYFQITARYPATSQNYTSCEVQIDSAIPKNR